MHSSQDRSPCFLPCFNNPLPATQFSINESFAPPILTPNHSSVSYATSPPETSAAFMKNHAFTRHQPEADHPLFSSVLNRKNNPAAGILGDLVHHDKEAVRYFLSSQVRPGGDVSRIYKCSVCRHEFPNAQAYGGHMSSHSKSNKKSPRMKKAKGPKKGIKRLKTMDMDSVKGRIVIEEALNVEIQQGNADGDEDDEDWFKFLNCDAV